MNFWQSVLAGIGIAVLLIWIGERVNGRFR